MSDEELLPDEPTQEQKEEMYQAAVMATMKQLAEPIENALNAMILPHPLPPRIAAMAVAQAVTLLAVGLARDGDLKLSHLQSMFKSTEQLAESLYPDMKDS